MSSINSKRWLSCSPLIIIFNYENLITCVHICNYILSLQVIEKQHRMMEQLGSQLRVLTSSLGVVDVVTIIQSSQESLVHFLCVCVSVCVSKALEEQVSQEDSGSLALREEVFSKERSLLELRTAMKEVSYDAYRFS